MLAIYCRISGNKAEGKDTSIEIQTKKGIEVALSLGLNYKVYQDVGISGAKDEVENRPEFAQMIADIEDEIITAVYVLEQARLERSPNVWNIFLYLVNKKKVTYYPDGKLTDLTDPIIQFSIGVQSLANNLYTHTTRKKVKDTFNLRATEGKTHGITPYGYKKSENGFYEIVKEEEEIIKRIFQMSLDGIGTYSIAKIFNQEGIQTKFNKLKGKPFKRKDSYTKAVTMHSKESVQWRGNVIYSMLTNTSYKGHRVWNKATLKNQKPIENEIFSEIPAIIDPELFDKVNRNLEKNKINVGKKEEYNYLLNGIFFCADCQNEYRGKKRLKGHDSAYKCKSGTNCSNSRGINISKIETFVINHLFIDKNLEQHLLTLPSNDEQSSVFKGKHEKLKVELAKKIKLKDKYLNWLEDDDLDSDQEIKEKYKKVKREIEILKDNIEIITVQLFESDNEFVKSRLKNVIGSFELTAKFENIKKLVHSIIEKIVIKHTKEKKGGFFVLEIKYKGFDESFFFATNWVAMKWNLISYSRGKAINSQQLEEDIADVKALFDYKGIAYSEEDFVGFEGNATVVPRYDSIILNKEELIHFD